jgi:hypothetical protein
MRKFTAAGILAVFSLFLPSKSHAVPLDVPNHGTAFSMVVSTSNVILSSTSLPTSTYPYQWCLEHIIINSGSASNFTMYVSSMNTLTPSVTNYFALTTASTAYDHTWDYRTPYCAPAGDYLGMIDSVAGSTITIEGYAFGGWSNP